MSVEWDARLQAVELPKSMVNALVLDWLVNQGHHDAAAAFVRESGTPAGDLDGIAERMSIRQAVEAGRMQAALEALEALHPALLSVDPPNGGSDLQLLFALQQQHFIELVRAGDVAAALTHAQHKLAPLAEAQPALVEPLELTMMLLASADGADSPSAHLLHPSQRRRTATALNAAILRVAGAR
uniref:CTLH domain-containing protein n=1 Tax=Emiliania huxleyi TaxID=2903 RepID=A0A7S3REB3_EMIHU